jgi:membrane associated rhomboid family serine protease
MHDGPSFHPYLTRAIRHLLLANATVFVANLLLAGGLSMSASGEHWFALSWSGLFDGYGLGLLRLVTNCFTHDFLGAMHFVFNMFTLFLFGHVVEGQLGYRGTWKLYLAAGVAGGVVQLALQALVGKPDVPSFGASGACYAMMVFTAFVMPRARTLFGIDLRTLVAILVGIGLYQAIVEVTTGFSDGTAHGGHLGGALFGWLAHRFGLCRDFGARPGLPGIGTMRQRFANWRAGRQASAAAGEQAELDRVLEKVHDSGLNSLTDRERQVLTRASARARQR